MSLNEDMIIDISDATLTLMYINAELGWRIN
jgi:hypothetical protein